VLVAAVACSIRDVYAYLISDLELLARADVGGLGDGSLQPREGLVVQVLYPTLAFSIYPFPRLISNLLRSRNERT
jgi:hypothetical protein